MKRIAVLHTLKDICSSFSVDLRSAVPGNEDVEIYDTLDEFLAISTNLHGLTPRNMDRLLLILKVMELAEPDLIVYTCTAMYHGVEKLRGAISTPIVAVDDEMCVRAIRAGQKIAVPVSSAGFVGCVKDKLISMSEKEGKEIEPTVYFCPEAMTALRGGDRETHDRIVMNMVEEIKGQDIVILPQASMTHLSAEIAKTTQLPVLTCPDLCIEYIRKFFSWA